MEDVKSRTRQMRRCGPLCRLKPHGEGASSFTTASSPACRVLHEPNNSYRGSRPMKTNGPGRWASRFIHKRALNTLLLILDKRLGPSIVMPSDPKCSNSAVPPAFTCRSLDCLFHRNCPKDEALEPLQRIALRVFCASLQEAHAPQAHC